MLTKTGNYVASFSCWCRRDGQTAKMEVMKDVPFNPIMQDESKGKPRYYTYGVPFFNYGLIPQTWEDPHLKVMCYVQYYS